MNDLRWTELATDVVAWHNRHPLARHISLQHVHSLGYVMLPFVDAASVRGATGAAAKPAHTVAGVDEPLPPEAATGSLRERAMARAQLEAQGAAAMPDDAPPSPAAPAAVRPAFDEDFIPPHSAKAARRWAARQAVAQSTPRGDVQVRKVRPESGVAEGELFQRWLLTAQIEVGRARTRVLVGPGKRPAVLGRRLISPGRTLALFALAGVLAGVAGWVADREPAAPAQAAASTVPAASAATAATAATADPAASVALTLPAPPPQAPQAVASSVAVAVAVEVAPVAAAGSVASSTASSVAGSVASSAASSATTASVPAATATAATAERPLDVEPRLGKVDLPSLGPRVDERRRRAQEAAASAAAPQPTAQSAAPGAAPRQAMATAPPGPSFAVATRLLRTRSESEQVAAAMRELLTRQTGAPVRVEVLAAGDDWRVIGWPYLDRALADKARDLLAARGMKVQVIDF
jgi:hypothetical protein